MNETPQNLRTFPTQLGGIIGNLVKHWTTTNPEAVRRIFAWHTKHENFLFKTRTEQIAYLKKHNLAGKIMDKSTHIEKQINLLKQTGKLPS
jgi:hypothetical protein